MKQSKGGGYVDTPDFIGLERAERLFAEEEWLMYMNRYLCQTGIISAKEYECMVEKIAARSSRLKKSR